MIRDIHGFLPSAGLPPFVVSLCVLFLGITWAISRIVGKKSVNLLPEGILPTASDSLEQLRSAFERGEISVSILCERLAQLLRAYVTKNDNPAMTSSEVIEAATGYLPDTTLRSIAEVLELCDRARFGGGRPATASVLKALDGGRLILIDSAENGP